MGDHSYIGRCFFIHYINTTVLYDFSLSLASPSGLWLSSLLGLAAEIGVVGI